MKIVFLHIPKTAGQSVHAALLNAYGAERVCPARVNDQLYQLSVTELNRYSVFSGHLDWSMLDCIKGPKFVFTILREPRDRILSFYFFLRDQASKMRREDLEKPQHQGLKAAIDLSPKDYFLSGAPHLRRFLDDHYDNFYTNYFAGRHYQARTNLAGLVNRGALTRDGLINLAMENIATLDAVFDVNNMAQVFAKIRELSGAQIQSDEKYRVNVNNVVAASERADRLKALGGGPRVAARLTEYCSMDDILWDRLFSKEPQSQR